jgi:hypothetical protein
MSAEEVLAAFRRGAPNLFLGAAFAAVGTVSLPLSCRYLPPQPAEQFVVVIQSPEGLRKQNTAFSGARQIQMNRKVMIPVARCRWERRYPRRRERHDSAAPCPRQQGGQRVRRSLISEHS